MRIYHGEVFQGNQRAEQIAAVLGREIEKVGGTVQVGLAFLGQPAILMLMLPDNVAIKLDELVEGVTFYEVHALHVPQVPDQGIRE